MSETFVRWAAVASVFLAAVLSLAPVLRAQDPVRTSIEAANRKFVVAFGKADAAGVAALYTADAQAFPPNEAVLKGRPAIEAMWKGAMDAGITSITLTTTEVESQGGLAFEIGTYEMKLKDGKVADHGKFLVAWKKVSGAWQLHRDIWNSSMPAPK